MLPQSARSVVLLAIFKQKVALWETIYVAVSCQTLQRLRRAILTSGVIHDNARPHNAVVTQQLLEQFRLDESDHTTYSPDLATSDFHLFPELKNWLGGQSFQKNEEIQSNVMAHLTLLVGTFIEEWMGTWSTDMKNA
ncbi:hypothetical protein AVEN_172419-1 [Araneus ventricosus]|uniref:Histone-lysine N-methyltransferase SETMAR n=1 Tax=Araneus ventricosus TaxID=182803 RepID=A0A4Y2RG20_ARAVE|nr:hypothetical protein AVEN_74657-1 [Araneus ventricosus]GBN74800.1 hypothetical protein AVEN_172419-1 [Araneus ventricosus]